MSYSISLHGARNFPWGRSYWLLFLFGTFWMALAKNDALQAQDTEILKQHFLKEAPAGWEAYRVFVDRLQGTIETRYTKDEQLRAHARCEIKQNADSRLWMTQRLPDSPPPKGEVMAVNPNYAFMINRSNDKNSWVLINVSRKKTKNNRVPEDAKIRAEMTPLYAFVRLQGIEIQEVVRQPTFQILHVESVQRGNLGLLQVDFDNSHPVSKEKQYCPVQKGHFIFAPDHHWCLTAYDVQLEYPDVDIRMHANTEFDESPSGYPIPKHFVSQSEIHPRPDGAMSKVLLEQTFQLEEPTQLPMNEEFTLTAYGLPEPTWLVNKSPRWHVRVALAGIICLFLAAFFRWRSRRAKKQATP